MGPAASVGEHLLKYFNIARATRQRTSLLSRLRQAARNYGK